MFLNIIRKSEASYLCCYWKRSYTESIERLLAPNFCAQNFLMSEIILVEGFKTKTE